MALFGGLSKALGGYNSPGGDGLAFADKLGALGALLMGDQNAVAQAKQMGLSRQETARKQAMQKELAGILGLGGAPMVGQTPPQAGIVGADIGGNPGDAPRLPSYPTSGGLPSLRAIGPDLLRLQMGGLDINPIVSVLDKAGPDVKYERGMRYDARDPGKAPAFIPDMDKGQMPLFDAQGNIVAVRNIDGSVQSAAEMAGAVEGAKRAASAPYDFVNLPTPTGAPMVASKSQAAGRAFIGQAPADAQAASIAAKTTADARANLPQAVGAANNALGIISQIRNHPARRDRVGLPSMLPAIPGSEGKDFDVLVDQARGQVFLQAFESLKGAGQITEMEGKAATAAIARIDRAQSQEGFDKALSDLEGIIRSGVQRAQQKAGAAPRGRPDRSAVEAELRRRGLIQ